MKRRSGPLLAILLIAPAACIDTTPQSQRARVILVASEVVRDPVEHVLERFAELRSMPPVPGRFALCAEAARSAARGEAQVLITVHPSWADYVAERAPLLDRAAVASNRLVVLGPSGSDAAPAGTDPTVLLAGGLRSIAVPSTESSAVGMYAREALLRYGIWSQMQTVLRQTPGSAAALGALANGDVDAAIALASDGVATAQPVIMTIDSAFHRPILVEVLLLDDTSSDARMLFDLFAGMEGSAAFVARGFSPPR